MTKIQIRYRILTCLAVLLGCFGLLSRQAKVEESVPCLYGDYLYILSCDGYLHAVR